MGKCNPRNNIRGLAWHTPPPPSVFTLSDVYIRRLQWSSDTLISDACVPVSQSRSRARAEGTFPGTGESSHYAINGCRKAVSSVDDTHQRGPYILDLFQVFVVLGRPAMGILGPIGVRQIELSDTPLILSASSRRHVPLPGGSW